MASHGEKCFGNPMHSTTELRWRLLVLERLWWAFGTQGEKLATNEVARLLWRSCCPHSWLEVFFPFGALFFDFIVHMYLPLGKCNQSWMQLYWVISGLPQLFIEQANTAPKNARVNNYLTESVLVDNSVCSRDSSQSRLLFCKLQQWENNRWFMCDIRCLSVVGS